MYFSERLAYNFASFDPYTLPASGLEDVRIYIIVMSSIVILSTFGYWYSSKKLRNNKKHKNKKN
jgi:hypothetical protein